MTMTDETAPQYPDEFTGGAVGFKGKAEVSAKFNTQARKPTSNQATVTITVDLGYNVELFYRLDQLNGQNVQVLLDHYQLPWEQPEMDMDAGTDTDENGDEEEQE